VSVRFRTGVLLTVLLSLPAAALASPVEEIRKLFEREMYRTGVPRLESFLKENPDSAEGQALLAELRYREKDWEGAEEAALKAIELGPSVAAYRHLWARARFQLARQAAADGTPQEECASLFERAEKVFLQVQKLDPQNPDVLWWIGWAKEWQGRQSIGRQFYDSQIREFPRYAPGYVRMGQSLVDAAARAKDPGKLRREALAVFDAGLERAGEDAELLYFRALVLLELREIEKGFESFLRSLRADPDFERSWNQLKTKVDEEEVLVPLAIELLEKHPTSTHAARWAGFHTPNRKPLPGEKAWTKYELTISYVLPALEYHADDEELYKLAFKAAQALIGDTPKDAHNAKLAIEAFSRIHDAWKWDGDAANNLGFYFREVQKYQQSLDWYLKGVDRAPENQDILNDCGLMYLFHFPKRKAEGLPYFLKTVALVREGDQLPIRGYWDALENLCKHYWEVDRRPEKVIEYARLRYLVTKGVKPYNMSQVAKRWADKARKALKK
jgi:tetratricopeptide (TPR) repeat protein